MNLLEALEVKRAVESIISDIFGDISSNLDNKEKITVYLTKLDEYVEELFSLERKIDRLYSSTMITPTESISDIISYVDCFSKKIEILRELLLQSNKNELTTGAVSVIDNNTMLSTIKQYEEIKTALLKKIMERCAVTEFNKDKDI